MQAGRTTLQALSMAAVLGTGLAAALHFGADGALELMGAGPSTGELHVLSQQYLQWRAWAAPAVLVTTVGQGTFRWAPQRRGWTSTDRQWWCAWSCTQLRGPVARVQQLQLICGHHQLACCHLCRAVLS